MWTQSFLRLYIGTYFGAILCFVDTVAISWNRIALGVNLCLFWYHRGFWLRLRAILSYFLSLFLWRHLHINLASTRSTVPTLFCSALLSRCFLFLILEVVDNADILFLMIQDFSQHHSHELCAVFFLSARPRLIRSQRQEITPGIHFVFSWVRSLFFLCHIKLFFSLTYSCPQMKKMKIHIK